MSSQNSDKFHLQSFRPFFDLYQVIQLLYSFFHSWVCFQHDLFCWGGIPLKFFNWLIGFFISRIFEFSLKIQSLFSCLELVCLFLLLSLFLSYLTIVIIILSNSSLGSSSKVIFNKVYYYGICFCLFVCSKEKYFVVVMLFFISVLDLYIWR